MVNEKILSATHTLYSTPKVIRRVSLGSVATLLGQGVNTLGQVLVVPLFLVAWGAELYGEWLTLYAVVAYVSVLDFGMQMYVLNRLNQSYSRHELDDYNLTLQSALAFYCSTTLVAAGLIAAIVYIQPIGKWLNLRHMDHVAASTVVLLLAFQLILAIPQGLLTGLYRTFCEFPRGAMLGNMRQFSNFGLIALVLWLGGSVVQVAALIVIPPIALIAYAIHDIGKRHPEVAIGFSRVDWKLAVTFLGPGLFFFLIQLSGALTIQGSILIVSAFAGPASVAIFVTHRTLTNLIRQLIGALNSALWPELTTLEANGDYSRLRTVHRLFVKTCFAVCLFAGIWLHFTGTNVIEVWTLGKIGFDQTLLDVFLIFLVLQAPWLGSSVFPASFNRHKHLSKCYLGSAVLGLVLALFFVQRFGLMGVVLGLMVADLLVCGWFVPLNTCRMLGENTRIFWAEILLRSVPVISMVWSTAWGLSQLITVPELRIFIIGGTVVLVGVVSGYFFWLNEEERGKMLSIGTTIWNRVVTSKPGKA